MADEAGPTLSENPCDGASQMNPTNLIAVGALTLLILGMARCMLGSSFTLVI